MTIPPVQRVFDLVEDNDFDAALRILSDLIRSEPDLARLHALRAFLLVESERPTEASISARRALDIDADDSYVQHAAAEVALALSEPAEAIAAARRARELDPDDDTSVFLEARAYALLGNWDAIVSRMDYILAGDPSNEPAAMFRAMALEAKQSKQARFGAADWENLAARFPLNPFARTGYAWRLLTSGRAVDAHEQFRQAIAVDPTSEWAKIGLVLALKSRYPGYGLLLRFFFWLHTLTPRTRMLLAIGGVLGYNFLRRTGEANPALKPLIIPVLIAYVVFVLATWLADPLLNLILMRHPEGRAALSEDDRQSGLRVGACLLGSAALALIGALTPLDDAFLSALCIGVTSLTVAGAYNCAPGKYRDRLLRAAAFFVVLGLGVSVASDPVAGLMLGVVIVGVVVSTWLARSWSEKSYA